MSCGNDLDVKVIDHIIYTDAGYLSFADAGILI
jgi:DNA repair protein RadC